MQISCLIIYFICDVNMTSLFFSRMRIAHLPITHVTQLNCYDAPDMATECTRPKSGGLCHLVCHSATCVTILYDYQFVFSVLDELYVSHHAWCSCDVPRVHYKSMKCDVSFPQGSVSTIFRWGRHCSTRVKKSCSQQCKNYKNRLRFSRVTITNVLPPFYGSPCIPVVEVLHINRKSK